MKRKKILFWSLLTLTFSCTVKQEPCLDYQLVYISKASGNFDIYKNDLNGVETQLTTNPSWDWSPMWNSALETILYYSYVNDTFRIRQMDLNGSLLEINAKELQEFNLSPDGKMVVMEESRSGNRQLVLIVLEDMVRTPITDSLSYNGRAKWSPYSDKIAFISDRDGNNEVYVYNLRTQKTARITNRETSEKYLTWAPDGEKIAFSTEYYEENEPDRNDIYIVELETMVISKITNNNYEDSEIAWSPKGDLIAFHSVRDDSVDHIYTMKIDGSDVKQISTNTTYHGEPDWIVDKTQCN